MADPPTMYANNAGSSLTLLTLSGATIIPDTAHAEELESGSQLGSLSLGEQVEPCVQSRLPLRESLGLTDLTTIIGGSILIIACVAFLSLLWFGHGDEPEAAGAPQIWRHIALKDWMSRTTYLVAVTITSLVLRSVVSFQVALCTSMTAALILEKRSARKSDVAYLSIARSVNDGPRRVAQLLFSSRSLSVLAYLELWLISLLALVMVALQFSSTLLLSDLHDYVVVGDQESRSIANFGAFTHINDSNMGINWGTDLTSPTYAVFGEERTTYNVTTAASGFSDTGLIRRGYLPFQGAEKRTSVRKYRGPTLVTNSRTVCVPPQIEGRFLADDSTYQELGVGHIVGNVDYGRSIRQALDGVGSLCTGNGCESVSFDCSVPGTESDNSTQSNICFIETVGRTSTFMSDFIIELPPSELLQYINMEGDPWSINSTMFLVFRSGLTITDWGEVTHEFPIPPARVNDEWSTIEVLDGRLLDISLCFVRFYIQPRYVSMIAQKPTHEPTIVWDGISQEHDTAAVSNFRLDPSATDLKTPEGISATILQRTILTKLTSNFNPNSFSGCIFCSDWSVPVLAEYALLFTDIIESTGRAAAALHSFFALHAATAYDSTLRAFDVSEVVEVVVTTSVRIPGPCSEHKCSGFISVTALLGVHLVIVAAITTLYVSQVRYSRLSNTWHAISQLMGNELEDVLSHADNAKDKSICKALKRDGQDNFVQLGLADGSTRVQVLKYTGGRQKPSEHKKSHRYNLHG
ncbi:hypothetical protein NUW58_g4647 [Xylaria curta]|uniref:Uncharacterized protein n=1 Tax=Xylaria curta TaxID=42375 RepID=A0ACC1P7R8_9PEZI|nr:hypothetical protein NUW58_g4647 [Xylaria curta]